jgi:hypothetical protein
MISGNKYRKKSKIHARLSSNGAVAETRRSNTRTFR